MLNKIGKIAIAGVLVCSATSAAHGESFGITLSLEGPVLCTVQAAPGGSAQATPGSFELGSLREYCNAPRGYDLIVRYTPGTLKGMTLIAGDERVELDGSGSAVVGRSQGPSIKNRNLE